MQPRNITPREPLKHEAQLVTKMEPVKRKEPAVEPIIDTFPVYKKITGKGHARYISFTRVVPPEWKIIEITAELVAEDKVILNVRRVV